MLHTSASILLSKLLSAYEIIIGLFQPLAAKDVGCLKTHAAVTSVYLDVFIRRDSVLREHVGKVVVRHVVGLSIVPDEVVRRGRVAVELVHKVFRVAPRVTCYSVSKTRAANGVYEDQLQNAGHRFLRVHNVQCVQLSVEPRNQPVHHRRVRSKNVYKL